MPNLTNENFKKTHNSAEELGRISNNIPGYAYFAHTANRRPMKHGYGKNTKKKMHIGQLSQENEESRKVLSFIF